MFERRPLGDAIARQSGGGTPSRQVASYWNGPIPWASVKDFADKDYVISSTQESITAQGLAASASNLIPAGTPLICTRMAVGRAAIAPMDVTINQDVKALFPAIGTPAAYLLRLLQYARPQAEASAVGSTVMGIRIRDYLSIPVPIAPLAEQPRIAQILATVDSAIRQTEAIIEKLRLVKQGLLQDLLCRGIDANGELRPLRSEAPHRYKETPIGWIPDTWNVKDLAEVANVIDPQPDHRTPREDRDGVPYIGIGDFDMFGEPDTTKCKKVVSTALFKQERSFCIEEGDIIFGKIGTIGEPKVLPKIRIAISANVLLIKSRVPSSYIIQYLQSHAFNSQLKLIINTTSQPALGIETMRLMKLAVPPEQELIQIAARLDCLNQRIKLERMEAVKMYTVKSGLMDDLLTGRVRVTPLLRGTAT